ncbi:unnamed protein product [Heterobilharzia americana]|nr:unnamed protein product [Heterobilharzia americana]
MSNKRPSLLAQKGPSSFKKPRGNHDDTPEPSKFEQELMLLDDLETEDVALVDESSAISHLDFLTNSHWPRPTLKPLDPNKNSIIFQQFDVSHYKGERLAGMPGAAHSPVPIIRLLVLLKMVIVFVHMYMVLYHIFMFQHRKTFHPVI